MRTGERTVVKRTPAPNVDLRQYTVDREWATGARRQRVPIDIVRHRDTPVDGTAPCLALRLRLLRVVGAAVVLGRPPVVARPGRVWALVHPRGGGELGRQWYLDGKLLAKRNTFTDTIACAEHSSPPGIAAPDRLAIRGGSAGGLLVGRVHDDAARAVRRRRRRGAVRRRRHLDERPSLPLTITEWEEWGDPREEPFGELHAGLLAVRQHRRRPTTRR